MTIRNRLDRLDKATLKLAPRQESPFPFADADYSAICAALVAVHADQLPGETGLPIPPVPIDAVRAESFGAHLEGATREAFDRMVPYASAVARFARGIGEPDAIPAGSQP